jgi:hypothetical protein
MDKKYSCLSRRKIPAGFFSSRYDGGWVSAGTAGTWPEIPDVPQSNGQGKRVFDLRQEIAA